MAEATGTNLTVPDQNQAVDNEPENKSGFMDTLGSAELNACQLLILSQLQGLHFQLLFL